MPQREIWIPENAASGTSVPIEVVERASPDIFTTTTADPGAAGTSLAVTERARFPQSGNFKIRVEAEVMLVTAGHGTGAGSFTVSRAQDGTTGVAHTSGVRVSQLLGVQRVEPVDATRQITYQGRTATFRTPGRAGTAGQKIFAIHNAASSPVLVDVEKIRLDMLNTVTKAMTTLPPIARLWRFTAVPTNGTALSKVPRDTGQASSSSVTVWGDASADGTASGTALTVTLPANNIASQEYGARVFTQVGYEPFDRTEYIEDESDVITLRALEGLCLFLDYATSLSNPTTDFHVVTCRWSEYTAA